MTLRTNAIAAAFATTGLLACADQEAPEGSPTDGGLGSFADGGLGSFSMDAGPVTGSSGIDLAGEPKHYRFIRLSNAQWVAAVEQLFKVQGAAQLAANFQNAVAGTTDFANNELVLEVNQRAWDDLRGAAEQVAEQATASDAALAAFYSGTDAAGFIASVGRRVYRRPLSASEQAAYGLLFSEGSAMPGPKSDFAKGAALVLRAMLQSPHFLYRSELVPAGAPLDGYEVAQKLSLWLLGTPPDDALLDAAERLTTAEAVAAQASAMLEDPRAVRVMREYQRELLHFDRYTQITKVNVPLFERGLPAELEETSYLFFDNIFTRSQGVREILTSTRGVVGEHTAPLYGLDGGAAGYVEAELGPARAGYFTQLPYLTLHGLNADSDAIHRGVGIALDVLCAPLGPPAAMIPPLPPLEPGQTNRQRVTALTAGCGGSCHNELINPLGFAFEHFDGLGRQRGVENGGLPIDSSGSFAFESGPASFRDAAELMQLLASARQTHLCYAKKLASFALQRDIVADDLPWLNTLADASHRDGASLKKIMIALAASDAFRKRHGGSP